MSESKNKSWCKKGVAALCSGAMAVSLVLGAGCSSNPSEADNAQQTQEEIKTIDMAEHALHDMADFASRANNKWDLRKGISNISIDTSAEKNFAYFDAKITDDGKLHVGLFEGNMVNSLADHLKGNRAKFVFDVASGKLEKATINKNVKNLLPYTWNGKDLKASSIMEGGKFVQNDIPESSSRPDSTSSDVLYMGQLSKLVNNVDFSKGERVDSVKFSEESLKKISDAYKKLNGHDKDQASRSYDTNASGQQNAIKVATVANKKSVVNMPQSVKNFATNRVYG